MTDEQLESARAKQAGRYPWLAWYVQQGPRIAAYSSFLLIAVSMVIVIAGRELPPLNVVGAMPFFLAAIWNYVVMILSVELLRLFMDCEIHLRRFVDGD